MPDRLADVTVALSLATDLGTGQPMEHGLRTCWLSLRTAEALGLDSPTRSCVYHTALLRFIGHSCAHYRWKRNDRREIGTSTVVTRPLGGNGPSRREPRPASIGAGYFARRRKSSTSS